MRLRTFHFGIKLFHHWLRAKCEREKPKPATCLRLTAKIIHEFSHTVGEAQVAVTSSAMLFTAQYATSSARARDAKLSCSFAFSGRNTPVGIFDPKPPVNELNLSRLCFSSHLRFRSRVETPCGIKNGERCSASSGALPSCPMNCCEGIAPALALASDGGLDSLHSASKNRWPRSLGRAFLNPVPALEKLPRPASRTPSRDEKARQATQRPHCVFSLASKLISSPSRAFCF